MILINSYTYPTIPINLTGLISYYSFDDNGNDEQGNNNGTVVGATYSSDGIVGKSLNCDTDSQYLQIPDANNLSFAGGSPDLPFSLCGWYKFFDTDTSSIVVSKRVNEYQLGWGYLGDTLEFWLWSQDSTSNYLSLWGDFTPTLNTWYHIAATYDGSGTLGGMKLYIDKVLLTSLTDNSSGTYVEMQATSNDVYLGIYGPIPSNTASFNGRMDCVQIWGRELSATDISNIYDIEAGGNLITG